MVCHKYHKAACSGAILPDCDIVKKKAGLSRLSPDSRVKATDCEIVNWSGAQLTHTLRHFLLYSSWSVRSPHSQGQSVPSIREGEREDCGVLTVIIEC